MAVWFPFHTQKEVLSAALGLDSVRAIYHKESEEKKAIIRTSRLRALCRSLVHILPMTLCIVLIGINSKGTYLLPRLESYDGQWTTTNTLAVLQIASKILVLRSPLLTSELA